MILLAIGIIGGLFANVIGLLLNAYRIENKKKVDSAHFLLNHVDKILNECQGTINILRQRTKNKEKKFESDHEVQVLLSRLENIIYYITEATIKKDFALIMLKTTLKLLHNDEEVQRIIKDTQENYGITSFEEIVRFMKYEI